MTASGKVSHDVRQRHQEQVAETVAFQPAPGRKAVLKEARRAAPNPRSSATMQLRMSPGGSTSNSRRRRPELPPSSLTVTIAVMSRSGAVESAALRILLQTLQERREAGAPADRDDAQR